jgi:ATP-dependent RNA helicase DHX29
MAAKKKKKPLVNPSRGFATSSIASKSKQEPVEAEETEKAHLPRSEDDGVANESRVGLSSNAPQPPPPSTDLRTLTPEELEAELERNDLQVFVETHGPKISREAQRQIGRIQTDSRVLRGQSPRLNLSPWLTDDMIDEIIVATNRNREQTPATEAPRRISEDTWVGRLWFLYQVLQGIGISKDDSLFALERLPLSESGSDTSTIVWGVRECFEILALECNEVQLPPYGGPKLSGEASNLATPNLQSGVNSPAAPQSRNRTPSASGTSTPLKLEVEDFEVSDYDSDTSPDELVNLYVATKSRLFRVDPELADLALSRKRSKPAPAFAAPQLGGVRKLTERLQRIESDTLFDKDEANQKWAVQRIQLSRQRALQKRLPDSHGTSGSEADVKPPREPPSRIVAIPDDSSSSSEDEILGDMFLAPDETSATKLPSTDGSVTLRNFGKATGFNPRRLLEDACRARWATMPVKCSLANHPRDPYAKLTFRNISSSAYVCQHSVSIAWSKPQEKITDPVPPYLNIEQEQSTVEPMRTSSVYFIMTTVGTPDSRQSESFVSTAALFYLFSSSPKEEKSHLKLGAAWRELWTELMEFCKGRRDVTDRETVKLMREILRKQLEREEEDGVVLSVSIRGREQLSSKNGNGSASGSPKRAAGSSFAAVKRLWERRIASDKYDRMLLGRMQLPIYAFRELALEKISASPITILCGETGCGKSTQLPPYILEDHLFRDQNCRILCTQPRRISAISLAQRVSEELGENHNEVGTANSLVGYAVRLESRVGTHTRLTYATVGVVLRMLESSTDLGEYTHLIIDEVHERSIETDFLLIILRDLIGRRPDFKVVLMSATVDAERFSKYLNNAPIITVPGRTFPVQECFLEDAIERTRYAGGKHNSNEADEDDENKTSGISEDLLGYSVRTRNTLAEYDEYQIDYPLIVNLIRLVLVEPDYAYYRNAILVFLPGIGEIRELHSLVAVEFGADCLVYPLHSSISSEEQQQAFLVPPPGVVKIVLATNIAETGVTIPDVTCVIDTGKHKEMRFDERRQLSRLVQSFISRANAKQRRGRAGRVQPGICFHLFTKKRHDELMNNQQTPEILRLSLQDLIMRVKICGLGEIEGTLARALDPPSSKNIRRAVDALIEVGALSSREELTPLGRHLAKLPLDAILGKLCVLSAIFGCLDFGITISSILSSKSPFLTPFKGREQAEKARLSFARGDSDLLTAYAAYCGWKKAIESPHGGSFAYCRKYFLNHQVLTSIEELKGQLLNSMADTGMIRGLTRDAGRGRSHRNKSFVQVPAEHNKNGNNDIIISCVVAWSFYPKLLVRDGNGWRSVANNQSISLHPTSVNKHNSKVKYLSYYSMMQSGGRLSNALSTSLAHELPLLLLSGEADFKVHAGIVAVDTARLRFSVKDWKTTIALKHLRKKMEKLVDWSIRKPSESPPGDLKWWHELFERMCTRDEKDVA